MYEYFNYEDFFAKRLAALRSERKVSAREMSLSIGQNSSYINRIENGLTMPSMQGFFYICEYLKITPYDFFNVDDHHPAKIKKAAKLLNNLDEKHFDLIISLAEAIPPNDKK